jgi:hypothetical protein
VTPLTTPARAPIVAPERRASPLWPQCRTAPTRALFLPGYRSCRARRSDATRETPSLDLACSGVDLDLRSDRSAGASAVSDIDPRAGDQGLSAVLLRFLGLL